MNELADHVDLYLPTDWGDLVVLSLAAAAWLALASPAGWALAAVGVWAVLAGYLFVGHVAIPLAAGAVAVGIGLRRRRGIAIVEGHDRWITVQAAWLMAGYVVYEALRVVTEGSEEAALANARTVVDFERRVGLFVEGDIQGLVTPHRELMRVFNTTYSYFFLATVVAAVLWLAAVDRPNFVVLRNGLGLSVVAATVTFASFPVAPPRLVPEAGIVDTVVVFGREHSFANEYAAVPSLHVGWMVLVGYVMSRSVGGRRGLLLGVLPGAVMAVTVIVTGNHWMIDGVVGTLFAVVPAWLTAHARTGRAARLRVHRYLDVMWASPRGRFTLVGLLGLLAYLLIGQLVSPGFTDYWGYMVLQMAVTLILLTVAEVRLRARGGLSSVTHVIAVSTGYADVLGTAGHLYEHVGVYDKITHFFGAAAVTAVVYDCLSAAIRSGYVNRWTQRRAVVAPVIGFALGAGWELWELIGDRILHTSRIGGWGDTSNDLISDAAGAIVITMVMAAAEMRRSSPWEATTDADVARMDADANPYADGRSLLAMRMRDDRRSRTQPRSGPEAPIVVDRHDR